MENCKKDSKRSKKIPNKFSDYLENDEAIKLEQQNFRSRHSLKNSPEKILRNQNKYDFMTHVSVPLIRLEGLDEIEPWCMTHCLYKCFCNGNNMIGKPFAFNNKPSAVIQRPIYVQQPVEEMIPQSRKRKYTFLKDDEDVVIVQQPEQIIDLSRSFEDLTEDSETARCVPINSRKWLAVNRKRRKQVIESLKMTKKELYATNTILKDHISKCFELVQYENKKKLEAEARKNEELSQIYIPVDILPDSKTSSFSNSNESSLPIITEAISLNTDEQNSTEILEPNLEEANKMKSKNIAKLNYYVSRAMTSICEIQKKSTKNIIVPKSKTINIVKWSCLVDAFSEDLVFIWEIRRDNELILAMTVSNKIPIIKNANSIVNVKAVSPRSLPLLAKMLFVKLNNERTKTLGVLLYGFESYWAIVGFTHSNYNYMELGRVVKLSPNQNPGLSAKIALLYKRMVEIKLISHPGYIENYEREQKRAYDILINKKREEDEFKVLKKKQKLAEIQNLKQIQQFPNMPTQVGALDLPFDVSTNILIDDANVTDPKSVFVPIPIVGDHRWLMLTIANDFSNIYIHPWKSFLKYDKIVNALRVAKLSNKTVKITSNVTDANPYVYATPTKDDKIFIGPYKNNETARIVLWQLLKGKFLLREDYERTMNIKRDKCTKGSWLYMKGDRIMGKSNDNESITSEQQSDDDCMIIDDEQTEEQEQEEEFIIDGSTDFEPEEFVINKNDHTYLEEEKKQAHPHPIAIHKVKRNFVVVNNQSIETEPPKSISFNLSNITKNQIKIIPSESLKRLKPFDLAAYNTKKVKLSLPTPPRIILRAQVEPEIVDDEPIPFNLAEFNENRVELGLPTPPRLILMPNAKSIEVQEIIEEIPEAAPIPPRIILVKPVKPIEDEPNQNLKILSVQGAYEEEADKIIPEKLIKSAEKRVSSIEIKESVSKIPKACIIRKITSDSLITKVPEVTNENPKSVTSLKRVHEYLDKLKEINKAKMVNQPPPLEPIKDKESSPFTEFTDNSIDQENEPSKVDAVIVLSEDEDSQPSIENAESVKGFLISNITSLGKIPCTQNESLEYEITLSRKRYAGSFDFIVKHIDM